MQRKQRSLPGPAGRTGPARPAASTASFGGRRAGEGSEEAACGDCDPDFEAQPWVQALQESDTQFDESRDPFRGNTVQAAVGMQHNAVLERLLAVVLTVRKCHSGEAFVRLKDPTGTIGGTLTHAVLESEPELRQGAVVRLRRVTLLRTPPPRSINHLCITLDSVLQVIPPPGSRHAATPAAATQQLQQPGGMFPALPAPPTAAMHPTASWLQPRQGIPPALQLPAGPGASRSHSFAWPSLGAAPSQPRVQQQLPPPCNASHGWPSLSGVPGVSQQRQGAAQQQQQQQQMPPPSARLPAQTGVAHPKQQSPGGSASVGFSLPSFLQPHQHQQAAWQDDATSGRFRQQAPLPSQVPVQAAGPRQQTQQQGGAAAAAAGWLAGLLAEAEFDPFASQQERPVLAERQPAAQQAQHATKRQCMGQPLKAQQQQSSPGSVGGSGGAVFAEGIDELDLDES